MKNSNGRHIFFVDDEPNIRKVITEVLKQNGSGSISRRMTISEPGEFM